MITLEIVLRLAIAAYFALLPPHGGRPPASAPSLSAGSWLEASGSATVYHGDLAGARDRAVAAALLRGLERHGGLRVEAATLLRQGELVDREMRTRTRGFVTDHELVAERREGDQLTVEVRLRVAELPEGAAFAEIARAASTLLVVCERNFGQPAGRSLVTPLLAAPFLAAPHAVAAGDEAVCAFAGDLPPGTVRTLADGAAAATVVVAALDSATVPSGPGSLGYAVDRSALRPVAAASGTVTLYAGGSGERLAGLAVDDVRGSDAARPERAGEEALVRAGERMRDFVVERLADRVAGEGYPLRVVVRGERAQRGAAALVATLESSRWVERVELVAEAPDRAELRAVCRERPARMVAELRGDPELEIVRFDAGMGLVEVR